MTLAHPSVLHLLWLLPVLGFVMIVQSTQRRRSLERFAEKKMLERLCQTEHKGRRMLKGILIIFITGLLILALAGPRWGSHYQEVSRKGVDIMVVVDASPSMSVEDVSPNRLEQAKREIIDLLKVVEGDRIGLTAFARAAFVLCPLTLDYNALEMFLDTLQTDIIPLPGTDRGAAIDTAIAAFDFKVQTDKVMLLITDGEDHEQRGLEAARRAARRGVKIFVFGIGEPAGGPIPAGGNQGGFKKDHQGKVVLSKLEENSLQQIAATTGGGYVRSVTGDLDLDLLYFDGIKRATEVQTLKSGKIKIAEERFHFFLTAAFFLLLLEGIITDKQRKLSSDKVKYIAGIVFCLFHLIRPHMAWANELSPDELYRSGRYAEAEKEYAVRDMDHPKQIHYRYNRGCAAFKNEKFQEAQAAFSSVMRRAQNPDLRFKAAYNLGNTAYKQGDLDAATAYFKEALAVDPTNEDARHNLELALRAIERNKQKSSEPKQNGTTEKKGGEKPSPQKDDKESEDGDHSGKSMPENQSEQKDTKNNRAAESDQAQQQSVPKEKQAERGSQEGKNPEQTEGASLDDETAKPESRSGETTAGGKKHKKEADQNLAGELKPLQELSESAKGKGTSDDRRSNTDQKKAEALFDNVQENPTKILRFMIPAEEMNKVWSGKDW